jgi:hypothetical protein
MIEVFPAVTIQRKYLDVYFAIEIEVIAGKGNLA